MNRRVSKANSITTYDTATLWRALEASSANQFGQKETARRWQRAANRLLRQNTLSPSPLESSNHSNSSSFPLVNCRCVSPRSSHFFFFVNFQDGNEPSERPESNLAFVRRKCDEWLGHGLPKLAQLQTYQYPLDECDLKIEKEWQPFLNDQARSVRP